MDRQARAVDAVGMLVGHAEDHGPGRAVLIAIAIDLEPQAQGLGVGDLIAHFSSDIAQLSRGVIRKPLIGLRAVTAMALYVPVMFILDGRLAIVAVITVPIAVYCVYRFAPKAAPALDEEKQRIADVLDEEGRLATWPHRHAMDGFFAVRLQRGEPGA